MCSSLNGTHIPSPSGNAMGVCQWRVLPPLLWPCGDGVHKAPCLTWRSPRSILSVEPCCFCTLHALQAPGQQSGPLPAPVEASGCQQVEGCSPASSGPAGVLPGCVALHRPLALGGYWGRCLFAEKWGGKERYPHFRGSSGVWKWPEEISQQPEKEKGADAEWKGGSAKREKRRRGAESFLKGNLPSARQDRTRTTGCPPQRRKSKSGLPLPSFSE